MRLQSAALRILSSHASSVLSRYYRATVRRVFGVECRVGMLKAIGYADVFAQLGVEQLEYPRSTLPRSFRYVDPLAPRDGGPTPPWWRPDLRLVVVAPAARPEQRDDLVRALVEAYRDTDAVVVTTTDPAVLAAALAGPIPADVHCMPTVPWSWMPRSASVLVTSGDWFDVNHALRFGLPVVVAGTLELDVEMAARVAWAGVGVDLRQGRPTPERLRRAVETLMDDPSTGAATARIAAQIARTDAERVLCDVIDELISKARVAVSGG